MTKKVMIAIVVFLFLAAPAAVGAQESLRPITNPAAKVLVAPHVAVGTGWEFDLTIVSKSNSVGSYVQVFLDDFGGAIVNGPAAPGISAGGMGINVPAGMRGVYQFTPLAGKEDTLRIGILKLEVWPLPADGTPSAEVSLTLRFRAGNVVLTEITFSPKESGFNTFSFLGARGANPNDQVETGLVVWNPWDSNTTLLFSWDDGGPQQTSVVVGPRERIVGYIGQLIQLRAGFFGTVAVTATAPVFPFALLQGGGKNEIVISGLSISPGK